MSSLSIGDCFDNAMIESFWSRMQVEPPRRSHQICCSQEVPPHMLEMPVNINSILPFQEAFLVDAPTPNTQRTGGSRLRA